MRVSILLQITADDGAASAIKELTAFEKQTERPEDLGLSLAEGKATMAAIQRQVVKAQVTSWAERRRCCEACGGRRRSKGSSPVVFRTLYGDVELDSPRLHRCLCQPADGPATLLPLRALIPGQIAPKRLYLEARWSSLVPYAAAEGARLLALLDSIKRLLWHGNQHRAGEEIAFLEDDVDGLAVDCANLGKFARAVHEFAAYIASNAGSLINYGERFRSGERISSCLAESTVNAVISKRFATRQRMQWTKRGAHLLLQTRTRTLDGTLRPLFERWHPGLANDNGNGAAQAVAA